MFSLFIFYFYFFFLGGGGGGYKHFTPTIMAVIFSIRKCARYNNGTDYKRFINTGRFIKG